MEQSAFPFLLLCASACFQSSVTIRGSHRAWPSKVRNCVSVSRQTKFSSAHFLCLKNVPIQPLFNLISTLNRFWDSDYVRCRCSFYSADVVFFRHQTTDHLCAFGVEHCEREFRELNKKRRHHHKVQHHVMGKATAADATAAAAIFFKFDENR